MHNRAQHNVKRLLENNRFLPSQLVKAAFGLTELTNTAISSVLQNTFCYLDGATPSFTANISPDGTIVFVRGYIQGKLSFLVQNEFSLDDCAEIESLRIRIPGEEVWLECKHCSSRHQLDGSQWVTNSNNYVRCYDCDRVNNLNKQVIDELTWDEAADIYNSFEHEMSVDWFWEQVQDITQDHDFNTETWFVEGYNMDWRGVSGDSFKSGNFTELLKELLSGYGNCTPTVTQYVDHIHVKVSHHDGVSGFDFTPTQMCDINGEPIHPHELDQATDRAAVLNAIEQPRFSYDFISEDAFEGELLNKTDALYRAMNNIENPNVPLLRTVGTALRL